MNNKKIFKEKATHEIAAEIEISEVKNSRSQVFLDVSLFIRASSEAKI